MTRYAHFRDQKRSWSPPSWWCVRHLHLDCHWPLACACVCHKQIQEQLLDELLEYVDRRFPAYMVDANGQIADP